MELKYSQKIEDESKIAKGMGTGLNMSFKHSVAICEKLRKMMLPDAIKLLEAVVAFEKTIPFRRFKRGIAHKKGLGKDNIARFPWKASAEILKVLRGVEANADYKGLEPEKLKLVHIEAQKGIARKRVKPKGRWKPWRTQFVHIQAIAREIQLQANNSKSK